MDNRLLGIEDNLFFNPHVVVFFGPDIFGAVICDATAHA